MPLQQRLFHSRNSPRGKADPTNASQKASERARPSQPPESLKTRNEISLFERLRIVATFQDEEDSPKEGSSEKDAAEGEVKEGSAGSLTGPQNTMRVNSPIEENITQQAATRRSPFVSQHAGLDSPLPMAAAATAGGSSGSLPIVVSPGCKTFTGLDSARKEYGRGSPRFVPGYLPAYYGRSRFLPVSQEALQAKEKSDRIMASLNKQNYQGIIQVERRVFLGDHRLSGGRSSFVTNPLAPSTSAGARLRQDGMEVETGGADDMLDSVPFARQPTAHDGEAD